MPQVIEGRLQAERGQQFAVVVSRFNELVTQKLLEGAVSTLRRCGVNDEDITVVWVPGSFELPFAANELAKTGRYAAICCLGAVLQGETDHNQYINQQAAGGIMRVGLETGVPVLFGVLTCDNLEQALNRAGGKVGNKGAEAALAAVELASVRQQIAEKVS